MQKIRTEFDILIEQDFPYNFNQNELSFFRMQNESDERMSFGLAVFSTQSGSGEARLTLNITPWRSEADKVL